MWSGLGASSLRIPLPAMQALVQCPCAPRPDDPPFAPTRGGAQCCTRHAHPCTPHAQQAMLMTHFPLRARPPYPTIADVDLHSLGSSPTPRRAMNSFHDQGTRRRPLHAPQRAVLSRCALCVHPCTPPPLTRGLSSCFVCLLWCSGVLAVVHPLPADAWLVWPPATPVTRRPTTSSSSFLFDGGAGLRRRTRTWSDALRR